MRRNFLPLRGSKARTKAGTPPEDLSPSETIDDLTTGDLAIQIARTQQKLKAADRDVERYRRRMNAILDERAKRFGANLPIQDDSGQQEDSMRVATNSPTTINETPVVVTSSPWVWPVTAGIVAAALLAYSWLGSEPQAPDTPPVQPPVQQDPNWNIWAHPAGLPPVPNTGEGP